MAIAEETIVYRYFGTEPRMVFYLAAFFFLLLSILRFKTSFTLSLVSFLIFVLTAFFTYLDHKRHLLVLDPEGLSLSRLFGSRVINLSWSAILKITTQEYGFFSLLKVTRIGSQGQEFRVFSFMEDYYHFLKDTCSRSGNAQIDKLTSDLLTGQADF